MKILPLSFIFFGLILNYDGTVMLITFVILALNSSGEGKADPESALEFLGKHCRWAVVTLGSKGCIVKHGKEVCFMLSISLSLSLTLYYFYHCSP